MSVKLQGSCPPNAARLTAIRGHLRSPSEVTNHHPFMATSGKERCVTRTGQTLVLDNAQSGSAQPDPAAADQTPAASPSPITGKRSKDRGVDSHRPLQKQELAKRLVVELGNRANRDLEWTLGEAGT